MRLIIGLALAFLFIAYGVDTFLQSVTGVTYLQGDTIDNDLVSLKTGITVIEYEDHLLVKQSTGYVRFLTAIKSINEDVGNFTEGWLEINFDDIKILDILKLTFVVLFFPIIIGLLVKYLLKTLGSKLFSLGAIGAFSLIILFLATYKPLIDGMANIYLLVTYNGEASDATMQILENTIVQKSKNKKSGDSVLTAFLTSQKGKNEIRVNLGDEFKKIKNNSKISPPDLLKIIHSEKYVKANKKEKKKLQKEQIKYNANELRKLIFFIYADIDDKEESNRLYSPYAQSLVNLYFEKNKN